MKRDCKYYSSTFEQHVINAYNNYTETHNDYKPDLEVLILDALYLDTFSSLAYLIDKSTDLYQPEWNDLCDLFKDIYINNDLPFIDTRVRPTSVYEEQTKFNVVSTQDYFFALLEEFPNMERTHKLILNKIRLEAENIFGLAEEHWKIITTDTEIRLSNLEKYLFKFYLYRNLDGGISPDFEIIYNTENIILPSISVTSYLGGTKNSMIILKNLITTYFNIEDELDEATTSVLEKSMMLNEL